MTNVEATIDLNTSEAVRNAQALVTGLREVAKVLNAIEPATKEANRVQKFLNETWGVSKTKASSIGEAIKRNIPSLKSFNESLDEHAAKIAGHQQKIAEYSIEQAKMKRIMAEATEIVKVGTVAIERRGRGWVKVADMVRRAAKAFETADKTNAELGKSIGGHTTQLGNLLKQRKTYLLTLRKNLKLLDNYRTSVHRLTLSESTLTRGLGKVMKGFDKVASKTGSLSSKTGGLITKLVRGFGHRVPSVYAKSTKAALEMYKSMAGVAFKAASKAASLIGQHLVKINEGFGRIAGGGMKAFVQGISDMVRGSLQRLIEGLAILGKRSIQTFADLELSVKRIGIFAGLELGAKNTNLLEEAIKDLAKTTLFSMEEISTAFEAIGAIGQFASVDELKAVGDAVVKLSTATGETDLEKTSEILMTTMNAFGFSAQEAAYIASLLTKVANDSALSVSQIGDAMQYVAATSAAAGISIHETSALIGTLSNLGFQASRAGTSLNQAIQNMIKPTGTASDRMTELGITFFDMEGNLKSFEQIIPELSASLTSLGTDQERLTAMAEIFGIRGGRAIQALIEEYQRAQAAGEASNFQELLAGIEATDASLLTTQMDEMMDSTAGAMARLKGSLEALQATFGELLAPAVVAVADQLSALTEDPQVLEFFGVLATTISGVVDALLPLLANLMGVFIPVLNMLLPILNMAKDLLLGLFEGAEQGTGIFGTLVQILNVMAQVVMALLPIIFQLVGSILNGLMPILLELVGVFASLLIPLLEMAMGILLPVIKSLIPIIGRLAAVVIELLPFIAVMISLLLKVASVILVAVVPILDLLTTLIEALLPVFKMVLIVVNFLYGLFLLVAPVIELIGKLAGWLASSLSVGLLPAVETLNKLLIGLVDALNWVLDAFVKALDAGIAWAEAMGKDKLAKTLTVVRDAVKEVTDEVKDMNNAMLDSDKISADIDELDFAMGIDPIESPSDIADDSMLDSQGNLILTPSDESFEDVPLTFDPSNLEDAGNEIGEYVLSGTSVQDILDLGQFTGITPNIGVSDEPIFAGSQTTNVTIEKVEIVLDDPDPTLDQDFFIDRFADELVKEFVR